MAKYTAFEQIPQEKLLELQRTMILIRRFEEATIKGYQQKKVAGFLHTYIGTEAVGVGAMAHKQALDTVVTSYRCHGLGLAMGMNVNACMAELWGKVTGCVRGKGGSMHYFSKEHNFLGGHGIVGGQFPIGLGSAFEIKYNNKEVAPGKSAVSFIHFGDGALPQGTFHETLNMAALWDLPCIYVCEDNKYAMGTNNERILSNTNVSDLAKGYKIKGYKIDGMNVAESYLQFQKIVEEVRETRRPALVHAVTYRFRGHSVSDAALYRTKFEEGEWKQKDPIDALNHYLLEKGIQSESDQKFLEKEIKQIIEAAVDFAEKSPLPPLEELQQHTFSEELPLSPSFSSHLGGI